VISCSSVSRLLGAGDGAAQVVEVDTILLGDLVEKKWAQPVGLTSDDTLPGARQAVAVGGQAYGVPTYLCSNVIYADSPSLPELADGAALLRLLAKIDPAKPALVGNYKGSWTLPSAYLDAWVDTNGPAGMSGAYTAPVDATTMSTFRPVVDACQGAGAENPCLDGKYKDNTKSEEAFGTGTANGYVGYTERLFYIQKSRPGHALPSVVSAPLGGGMHPVMFVDALVFNPACTGPCLGDAQSFARYMSEPAVREKIAFSRDAAAGATPRYLLQASRGFYEAPSAKTDPIYKALLPVLEKAQPFPNQGFANARKPLNDAVYAELSKPVAAPAKKAPPAKAPPAKAPPAKKPSVSPKR
jgi:thiamine pyridinylase